MNAELITLLSRMLDERAVVLRADPLIVAAAGEGAIVAPAGFVLRVATDEDLDAVEGAPSYPWWVLELYHHVEGLCSINSTVTLDLGPEATTHAAAVQALLEQVPKAAA